MVERKNIDRVFRENLKDLEIYPSKKVWNNIEQRLLEKQPKKTIPLWRRLSGVAIIFILFFAGGISYLSFNSNSGRNVKNSVTTATSENAFADDDSEQTIENKISPKVIELAQIEKRSPLQKAKSIFVKKPQNSVITTSTDITTIYKTIENKYIINKEDFLEDIKSDADEVLLSNNDNSFEVLTDEKKTNNKKWSIGTTYSPVYYNTLTTGSPINEALAENVKSADDAVSLGLKVNYQLTNKINIQSGVNKVELAYNTKNVNATISSAKFAANNINTDKPGVLLVSGSNTPKPLQVAGTSTDIRNKSSINGDLNQSIEYFEFPIELKYNVFESKVGINVIGGFSTFILTNNSVSIVSQNYATSLGEANNLNSVNFSGNFGIDLDYKINSNWYLNVAPMFKYQFNTYTNSSGNFQPYYLGVYSGLNFRF
jgi:hypothetical protein